jgi:hypothetical protein
MTLAMAAVRTALLLALLSASHSWAQDFPNAAELQRQRGVAPELMRTPNPAPRSSNPSQPPAPLRIDPFDLHKPLTNTPIEPKEMRPFRILGGVVNPGEMAKLAWVSGESFIGSTNSTPVLVKHGVKPGPVLCLTGAVHGDELNGIEVVRRILYGIDPKQLSGTIIGVPIVNLSGFGRGSRYLPDRRDLNRFFPGNRRGSNASRIAYSFFNEVVDRCTHLVDFHTGSFERTNLPQVRGDLRIPAVREFTRGFGATTVLHSAGSRGMLRRACTDRGIAAVTFEIGAPIRLEPKEIAHGQRAIETLLDKLDMVNRVRVWKEPQPFFYESKWVRAPMGGMLFSDIQLGERVRAGQLLGRVVDPVDNHEYPMKAPYAGRVLGMALNQIVMPGFATYHMGAETTEAQAVQQAVLTPSGVDEVDLERIDEVSTATEEDDENSTEQVDDAVSERREEARGKSDE